jgi:hypothetical protein
LRGRLATSRTLATSREPVVEPDAANVLLRKRSQTLFGLVLDQTLARAGKAA